MSAVDVTETDRIIGRIRQLAANAGYGRGVGLEPNLDKVRTLQQICGPNQIDQVAQLFWDDYLATRAMESDSDDYEDVNELQHEEGEDDEDEEEAGDLMDVALPPAAPAAAAASSRRSSRRRPSTKDPLDTLMKDALFGKERRSKKSRTRSPPRVKQVMTSDGTIRNFSGSPAKRTWNADMERLLQKAKAAQKKLTSTTTVPTTEKDFSSPQQPKDASSSKKGKHSTWFEKDGYLSDNDWVWASVNDIKRDQMPTVSPAYILWGLKHKKPQPQSSNDSSNTTTTTNNNNDDVGAVPLPWLRVGMTLDDETALGLVVPEPTIDNMTPYDSYCQFITWEQECFSRQKKKQRPQKPPFYCRSVTAILSIITALLHTGARYNADNDDTTVNDTVEQEVEQEPQQQSKQSIPWAELTKEQRLQQFDARLTQALTCLLVRAAKAARTRKLRHLDKLRHPVHDDMDDNEINHVLVQRRAARRKLDRLCPVLGWPCPEANDTTSASNPNHHSIVPTPSYPDVEYAASLTSIDNLHLYVQSQLPQFQRPGGVVLLLETLVNIHGASTVKEMLREKSPESRLFDCGPLIRCKCQDDDAAFLSRSSDPNAPTAPLPPPRVDCTGVQLLSLLLTGKVQQSWRDWSTDPWGFGILSDRTKLALGKPLTRPLQSVWVLAGPTTYSVLWTEPQLPEPQLKEGGGRDDHVTGKVLRLAHWNPWIVHSENDRRRTLTTLSLTLGRDEWKPSVPLTETTMTKPVVEDDFLAGGEDANSPTLRILEERRRQLCRTQEQRQGLERVDRKAVFTYEEMKQVRPHSEDVKLYPQQYKLWRFDTSHWPSVVPSGSGMGDAEDSKPRSQWVPFYRLTKREQRLVEVSLGPSICNILRTRWPTATLDTMEPKHPNPLV
jgi:hypothetical protein